MGFLDQVKSWFFAEAEEASDMLDGAKDKLDATLSAKERDLKLSPEEKLDALGEEIESSDDPFEDIRQKVEKTVADADAEKEATEIELAERDAASIEAEVAEDVAEAADSVDE